MSGLDIDEPAPMTRHALTEGVAEVCPWVPPEKRRWLVDIMMDKRMPKAARALPLLLAAAGGPEEWAVAEHEITTMLSWFQDGGAA